MFPYVPSSAAKTDGFAALWREGLVLARASLWSMWGAFKKSERRGLCENVRFFVAAVILSRWTHWVTHWLNTRERTQVAPSRGWSDWDLHINSRKETWNCWKVWRLSNTPSITSFLIPYSIILASFITTQAWDSKANYWARKWYILACGCNNVEARVVSNSLNKFYQPSFR